MIGRLEQVGWTINYLRELEADFLVFYRIADPWSMPAPRFFRLALRIPYYAGAMQAKIMAEQERLETPSARTTDTPQISAEGVDMRHNMAAAKAAAKGLKNDDGEVKYVPASVFVSLPEVQGEYVQV